MWKTLIQLYSSIVFLLILRANQGICPQAKAKYWSNFNGTTLTLIEVEVPNVKAKTEFLLQQLESAQPPLKKKAKKTET